MMKLHVNVPRNGYPAEYFPRKRIDAVTVDLHRLWRSSTAR